MQRGSDRARRKPPKKHGNTWHPPVTGFKQTKQKLFAWLISARSSARAARFGAAAEAPTHTCLSSLGTLCSRVAAALAAQFSCEAAGAGYAASGAAHAAKPYRVSSGGIPKSAMESRSSFDRVTHRSQKVCFLPQQPLLCLCSDRARQTDACMICCSDNALGSFSVRCTDVCNLASRPCVLQSAHVTSVLVLHSTYVQHALQDDRTSGSPAELLMHQAQELFDVSKTVLLLLACNHDAANQCTHITNTRTHITNNCVCTKLLDESP